MLGRNPWEDANERRPMPALNDNQMWVYLHGDECSEGWEENLVDNYKTHPTLVNWDFNRESMMKHLKNTFQEVHFDAGTGKFIERWDLLLDCLRPGGRLTTVAHPLGLDEVTRVENTERVKRKLQKAGFVVTLVTFPRDVENDPLCKWSSQLFKTDLPYILEATKPQ